MFFFFLIPRTSHVYSHGFGVNIFNIIEKIKRLNTRERVSLHHVFRESTIIVLAF